MQPTSDGREVTLARPAGSPETEVARRFGVSESPRDPDSWQFVRSPDGLFLIAPQREGPMRLEVCATQGQLARRLRSVRPSDPLPRAAGIARRKKLPAVVDATGGLCRDAMSLAVLGCSVTALERIPALAMAATLLTEDAGLGPRLQVVLAEATSWLATAAAQPDVVYLDPMFSEPGRAQVKKEMQICRALAGPSGDTTALFAAARAAAIDRVVVKRHPHDQPLAGAVDFTVSSERIRFDVYLAPNRD